jgi:IMP dehydrogenase
MTINAYLDQFMEECKFEALTFDDVSLITQYSDFLPPEADLSSRFSRNISLSIPLVSAAMDTVTEADMAIAMAMQGGIGVLHKNLDPEDQAEMVERVKHHLNGMISDPITFNVGQTLQDVHEKKRQRGYSFSGFPILDSEERVVGILTAQDVKYSICLEEPVEEIMTRDVVKAAAETTLEEAYEIMRSHRVGKLPLTDESGRLLGLYSYTDVKALIENSNPLYNRDSNFCLRVAAAIGPADYERCEQLIAAGVDAVVIDTAHGHSKGVIDMVKWTKQKSPETDVVAGNIATGEAALALRDAGADAVKVGIGPGSICTTRVVAGVGVPQISAVYSCAQALQNSIPIISDGGIRHSGDVPKALVAGAHSVMMGSVLAGTDESPGEKIITEGRQYVVYRGMGSLDAMKSRQGSRERYGQSNVGEDDLVPQGIEGIVPYAGHVAKVIIQFCGGIRASMGYCGCRTVEDLRSNGKWVRITMAGVREAHPHDIRITKEAPNYRS